MFDLSGSADPVPELAFLVGESGRVECMEQGRGKMPRHQSRTALQLRGNRENQKTKTMVDR